MPDSAAVAVRDQLESTVNDAMRAVMSLHDAAREAEDADTATRREQGPMLRQAADRLALRITPARRALRDSQSPAWQLASELTESTEALSTAMCLLAWTAPR